MSYCEVRFLNNVRAELSLNNLEFSDDFTLVILWVEVSKSTAMSLSLSERHNRMQVRISCCVILGILFRSCNNDG